MKSLIFQDRNAIFDTQDRQFSRSHMLVSDEKKDSEDWDFTADVTRSIPIQDMIFYMLCMIMLWGQMKRRQFISRGLDCNTRLPEMRNFIAPGNLVGEISVLFRGNEELLLAGSGLADVQVIGLPSAVLIRDRHLVPRLNGH